MRTSSSKKIFLFIGIIFLIGIIIGGIFVFSAEEWTKEIISSNINEMIQNIQNIKINNIYIHAISLSTILVLSLFIVGLPLAIIYVFYSGFSAGFTIFELVHIFGLKGLLFGIIYLLITKGLFFFLTSIFLINSIKLGTNIFLSFLKKGQKGEINTSRLKKCSICIFIILLNDLILYFSGAFFINIFKFLII